MIEACEIVHQRGVPMILVSRGKEGLILSTMEKRLKAAAPPVKADSTVGAGDSVVAGFTLARSMGWDLVECLRLACAAGTATALTPGNELCHKEDVERIFRQVEISSL